MAGWLLLRSRLTALRSRMKLFKTCVCTDSVLFPLLRNGNIVLSRSVPQ